MLCFCRSSRTFPIHTRKEFFTSGPGTSYQNGEELQSTPVIWKILGGSNRSPSSREIDILQIAPNSSLPPRTHSLGRKDPSFQKAPRVLHCASSTLMPHKIDRGFSAEISPRILKKRIFKQRPLKIDLPFCTVVFH